MTTNTVQTVQYTASYNEHDNVELHVATSTMLLWQLYTVTEFTSKVQLQAVWLQYTMS